MLAQKLAYHLEEGLGIEITTHLAVQPDRGASINKVGNLDHMPLFALRISRNTTGIFQIELDFLARLPERQRFGLAATMLFNAACLAQDLPDGRLGTWQVHIGTLEYGVAMDIVEDRFWSRDALQVLRRSHSNLQDALDDGWLGGDGGRWRVPRSRVGVQRHDISRISLAYPPEPLADPGA
jgi:hypothetical protein